jgi:hypothetical protein
MVPPAARLAGSAPPFTVKALFEVLNWAICMADVPGFVMDMVRDAGVPIVTSPKSIAEGFTESSASVELVEENGCEFEPQPERPRLSAMAASPSAMAQAALRP